MEVVFLFVVRLWLVFSILYRTVIVERSHTVTKAVGNSADQFELICDHFSVCFSAYSVVNPVAPEPISIAAGMLRLWQPLLCLQLLPKPGRSQLMGPARPRLTVLIIALILLAGDVEVNPGPEASDHNNNNIINVDKSNWINVGSLNCCSVANKVALVHSIILDHDLDFMALNETWFTTDTPISIMNDIAPKPGYSSLHAPRPIVNGGASRGGGLSIIHRDTVVVRNHPLANSIRPSSFELQLVRVGTPPSAVHAVFNIYRQQRIPQRTTSVTVFVEELGDIITSFAAQCSDNIIVLGDLNAPGFDGSHIDDGLASLFDSCDMKQFIDSPTRDENLLDILASTDPSAISEVSVNDGGRLSDHQMIVAKLAVNRSKPTSCGTYRNIKAIDMVLFERALRESSLFHSPNTTVDGFADQLKAVVSKVLDIVSPFKQHGLRRLPNPTSKWLSKEAINAKRHRRQLKRRWLSSGSEKDRKLYRHACRSTNKIIQESRKNHFRDKLSDCRDNKESAGTLSKSYFILHMQVTVVVPIKRTLSFAKLSLTFSFLKVSISNPPLSNSSAASHHFLFFLTFQTSVQHSLLFLLSPLPRFSKFFPLKLSNFPLLISCLPLFYSPVRLFSPTSFLILPISVLVKAAFLPFSSQQLSHLFSKSQVLTNLFLPTIDRFLISAQFPKSLSGSFSIAFNLSLWLLLISININLPTDLATPLKLPCSPLSTLSFIPQTPETQL